MRGLIRQSIFAGLLATVGLALATPTVIAQVASDPIVDANEGFTSPDGGDGIFDSATGPLDLIHRAVLMNNTSLSEFQEQQQGRISDEAAGFREAQQQAIRDSAAVDATPGMDVVETGDSL